MKSDDVAQRIPTTALSKHLGGLSRTATPAELSFAVQDSAPVTSVCPGAGGKLYIGMKSGHVDRIDLASGSRDLWLNCYANAAITCLRVNPQGIVAVAGSEFLTLWDADRQFMRDLSGTDIITSLAFSPSGRLLLAGGRGGLALFDLASGRCTFRTDTRDINGVCNLGDESRWGVCGAEVWILDASRRTLQSLLSNGFSGLHNKFEIPRRGERSTPFIGVSGNAEYLVAADHLVRVWNLKNMRCIREIRPKGMPLAVAVKGRRCAVAQRSGWTRNFIQVVDLRSEKETEFDGHRNTIMDVQWGPELLYSGAMDSQVREFDVDRGTCVRILDGVTEPVFTAKLDAGDSTLAVAGDTGAVSAYSLLTGRRLWRSDAHRGWVHAMSWNGSRLATGGDSSETIVFDGRTGAILRRFGGNARPVWSVAFSSDGRRLLSVDESGSLSVRHMETGRVLSRHELGSGCLHYLLLLEDRQECIAGGWGSVKRVSLRDGRVLAEYAASVEAFSLATSRRHLLTAGIEGTISLFDFESGRPMQRVQAAHAGRMKRVLCTPDGLVVSSGADALVKIWRLESGRGLRFVHALTDHMDSVTEMTLTADGRVCTASRDGVVRFFERKDDQLTLLGTLHNLRDGFLWTTPNSTKEKGCFWTDRPDLIQVSARQGSERQVLAKGDTRRSEFIAIHNSDIVMMQIRDARAYEARLSLRSDRVEIERRLRTHRLSKRLPGSPHREARS